jgi:hypothetical protein
VRVDLSAPRRPLAQDGPFELICGPEEAADRLGILADLGYDDALLAKPIDQTSQDLIDMRALLPRHDGQ